jgi:hypothetical protein
MCYKNFLFIFHIGIDFLCTCANKLMYEFHFPICLFTTSGFQNTCSISLPRLMLFMTWLTFLFTLLHLFLWHMVSLISWTVRPGSNFIPFSEVHTQAGDPLFPLCHRLDFPVSSNLHLNLAPCCFFCLHCPMNFIYRDLVVGFYSWWRHLPPSTLPF